MKRLLFFTSLVAALYAIAAFIYFPMFKENIEVTYDYYDKICDLVYSARNIDKTATMR